MKIKNIAKGAAKLVGITFAATAAIAVVTSGEALKAIGTGFQVAGEAVKKYVYPEQEKPVPAEEPAEATEVVEAAEEDFEA